MFPRPSANSHLLGESSSKTETWQLEYQRASQRLKLVTLDNPPRWQGAIAAGRRFLSAEIAGKHLQRGLSAIGVRLSSAASTIAKGEGRIRSSGEYAAAYAAVASRQLSLASAVKDRRRDVSKASAELAQLNEALAAAERAVARGSRVDVAERIVRIRRALRDIKSDIASMGLKISISQHIIRQKQKERRVAGQN